MKDGYSICLNEWALDKSIKNELGLLLIISSLCAEKGYCFASNKYLAELLNITEVSVSRRIKRLKDRGHILVDYEKRGCEVKTRFIRLSKMITDDYQKCKSTIIKNDKDNNISINNISINKKENIKRKSFIKPTIEEIQGYCLERQNGINAEAFYDFYESKNWYVGKNKMVDWKACVRTWERRNPKKEEPVWINADINTKKATEKEKQEMENLLKEFK